MNTASECTKRVRFLIHSLSDYKSHKAIPTLLLLTLSLSVNGKWFEPRSLSRLCGLIVRVRVVPRRTVVGDIDRRFDNLSGSHHQSHVNCVSSVYGIYVSGQFSRDVIGCFKSNRWLGRDVIGCWFVRSCCFTLRSDHNETSPNNISIVSSKQLMI